MRAQLVEPPHNTLRINMLHMCGLTVGLRIVILIKAARSFDRAAFSLFLLPYSPERRYLVSTTGIVSASFVPGKSNPEQRAYANDRERHAGNQQFPHDIVIGRNLLL